MASCLALAGININPVTALASTTQNILGWKSSGSSNPNVAKATIKDGVQTITITANNNGYSPNSFYVQKGTPVRWIINGDELNSCNETVVIPALNKEQKLKKGENVIEFTPGDKDINFSCWMGMIRGVIKVTDKLDSVDTSKNDSSLPPPSTGPSCCAGPATGYSSGSSASSQSSIYGSDITKIPTSILINKAKVSGNSQSAAFNGKGYELQPLIIVTGNSTKTKLTFDLSAFDNAEGEYQITDAATGEKISSFTAKKGINVVEFTPTKVGGYAILKDNDVLGIIEVVNNLKRADVEQIRNKYLNQ